MNEQQHKQTKKKLKICGGILLAIGVICVILGFLDFSLCFAASSVPTLFFLIFLGFPMIFIGSAMLLFGFKKEIGTYVKNESVPVINEAAEELSPAVKSVVGAVKEGIKGDIEERKPQNVCPHCGKVNLDDGAFCSFCGKTMEKVCPFCGAKQSGENAYCGKCGSRLN